MLTASGIAKKGGVVLALTLLIGMTKTVAAPITFNTALPVGSNEFIARAQLIRNQSGDDPSGMNRDRSATTLATALGYGFTAQWSLFAIVPYHDIELTMDSGAQRVSRKASGLGDSTVFARYIAHQVNQQGQTFRIAPFAGIKLPTGEDDKTDSLGTLPPSMQLGSGSWDPLFGVVATYQTLQYQLDGQLSYSLRNEANDIEAGDVLRLDGSLQYRLLPKTFSGGIPNFVYGVIETNIVRQAKNKLNGSSDPDSGGSRVFVTPGIQYVTRRWIAEAALQLPLVQDLNGNALENDYIARISLRGNF